MFNKILQKIIESVLSWALSKAVQYFQSKKEEKTFNDSIDSVLIEYKEAFKEAYNGEPITSEQKEKLRSAIRNLIKSNSL